MKRNLILVALLVVGLGAGTGVRVLLAGGGDAADGHAEASDSVGHGAADSLASEPEAPAPGALAGDAAPDSTRVAAADTPADTADLPEVERLALAMRESIEGALDRADADGGPARAPQPDSTPAPETSGDEVSAAPADAPNDAPAEDPATRPATDADGSTSLERAGATPAASVPQSLYSDAGSQRLAKIFGAMDPRDAAEVLQGLTDAEVSAILVQMSERKVASILSSFEPQRAASLSRTVLVVRSGGAS